MGLSREVNTVYATSNNQQLSCEAKGGTLERGCRKGDYDDQARNSGLGRSLRCGQGRTRHRPCGGEGHSGSPPGVEQAGVHVLSLLLLQRSSISDARALRSASGAASGSGTRPELLLRPEEGGGRACRSAPVKSSILEAPPRAVRRVQRGGFLLVRMRCPGSTRQYSLEAPVAQTPVHGGSRRACCGRGPTFCGLA